MALYHQRLLRSISPYPSSTTIPNFHYSKSNLFYTAPPPISFNSNMFSSSSYSRHSKSKWSNTFNMRETTTNSIFFAPNPSLQQPPNINSNQVLSIFPLPFSLPFSSQTEIKENTKEKNNLVYHSGCFSIPHPEKAYKGGEDAHFISEQVVGLADGVGGWADSGIDPSLYSKRLMHEAFLATKETKDPLKILQIAWEKSQSVTGSSTACIVSFDGSDMTAANIGDSGFLVIRDGKILFRSKEQQHYFNCPYQLGTGSRDRPKDADIIKLKVQEGDILVVGTDGLTDNLFDEMIVSLVKESMKKSPTKDPTKVAEHIARAAHTVGKSNTVRTPFGVHASQAGYDFEGGKMDDITVLVVFVQQNNNNDKENQSENIKPNLIQKSKL